MKNVAVETKRRGYAPLEGTELARTFLLNTKSLSRHHIQKLIKDGVVVMVPGERKEGTTRGKVPLVPTPTGKGRRLKAVFERSAKLAAEKAKIEKERQKADRRAKQEAKKAAKAAPASTEAAAA